MIKKAKTQELCDGPLFEDNNKLLIEAIKHALDVRERQGETVCGRDHARLAAWLEELYLRRTGKQSGAYSFSQKGVENV